jgi:hypothetical protein
LFPNSHAVYQPDTRRLGTARGGAVLWHDFAHAKSHFIPLNTADGIWRIGAERANQQFKGTWQTPGQIQQPKGPWQKPGDIQKAGDIQSVKIDRAISASL